MVSSPAYENLLRTQDQIAHLFEMPTFQNPMIAIENMVVSPAWMNLLERTQRLIDSFTPNTFQVIEQQLKWIDNYWPTMQSQLSVFATQQYGDLTQAEKEIELNSVLDQIEQMGIPAPSEIQPDIELSEEEKKEFADEISSTIQAGPNWQQRLFSKYEKYKEKNPVYAAIIVLFLSTLLGLLMTSAITWSGKLIHQAKVKEIPTADSEVMTTLPEKYEVSIVGNARYYYEIEYEDPVSHQILSGYLSKRSVQAANSENDE